MLDVDRDALERAMEVAMRDPTREAQLRNKLADAPWFDVAEFAAYCVQGDTLSLRPWEEPPCCDSAQGNPGDRLLQRMLAAGLSRYEPDPLGALARAARRPNA